jgi:hypothetical protein
LSIGDAARDGAVSGELDVQRRCGRQANRERNRGVVRLGDFYAILPGGELNRREETAVVAGFEFGCEQRSA